MRLTGLDCKDYMDIRLFAPGSLESQYIAE